MLGERRGRQAGTAPRLSDLQVRPSRAVVHFCFPNHSGNLLPVVESRGAVSAIISRVMNLLVQLDDSAHMGRTNRMAPTSAEYGWREGQGETGCRSDERPQYSSPADARDGRLRTCGIGDAEVAVLQGESGDPVARRASVNGLPGPARDEFWRPLLPGDVACDAHRATAVRIRWITSGRVTSDSRLQR